MIFPPALVLHGAQPTAARVKAFDALTKKLTEDLDAKRLDDLRSLAAGAQPGLEGTVAQAYALKAGLTSFEQPFVDSFPTDGPTLKLLLSQEEWSRSAIVWPAVVEQIFKAALGRSDKAMDRFMRLLAASDGAYSELIQGDLADLFKGHPKVVIAHWAVIQRYQRRCASSLEGALSARDAKVARASYRKLLPKGNHQLEQILLILEKSDSGN